MRVIATLVAAVATWVLMAADPQSTLAAESATASSSTASAPGTVTTVADPSFFTKKTYFQDVFKGTHLHGIAKNLDTGDLYVGDWHTLMHWVPFLGTTASNDDSIRKVAAGAVSRLASLPAPNGMVYNPKDHLLYIATGTLACAHGNSGLLFKCGGTHGIVVLDPATGTYHDFAGRGPGYKDGAGVDAGFTEPAGITYDPDNGNFYVVESHDPRIRQVTTDARVTTLAGSGVKGSADGTGATASFNYMQGITYCSADKNLYVADTNNNEIRRVTLAGVVSTLAGGPDKGNVDGPGATARFDHPWALACDRTGNLYVADRYNNEIREISPGGIVTTLAGSQQEGTVDGIGPAARFSSPGAITYSPSDNSLYVADFDSNVIRNIALGPKK